MVPRGPADGWVLIGGAPAAGAARTASGGAAAGGGGGGGGAALTRAPTLPQDFPELRALPAEELAALAADEAKYAAFVRRLVAASSVRQARPRSLDGAEPAL